MYPFIVQFENQAASPFTSANKGIHLHLPLKAIDRSAVHLAVLDCYEIIGTDEKRLLGIYIERRYERSSIFRRIRGRELGNMNRVSSQFLVVQCGTFNCCKFLASSMFCPEYGASLTRRCSHTFLIFMSTLIRDSGIRQKSTN